MLDMIGIDMFLHIAAIDSKRGLDAADISGLPRIAKNGRVMQEHVDADHIRHSDGLSD